MNRLFKVTRSSALIGSGLALTAVTVAPVNSWALASSSPFCTNLPNKAVTINNQLSTLVDKVHTAWTTQDQKITADEQKVDQDVTTDRQTADTKRDNEFTQLKTKATTDAEKQAVNTYVAAVNAAVTARRNAYDAARQTFRTGLENTITGRRDTLSSQMSTFQGAASAALSTAEAACNSNPANGPAIRTTLVASLKTARTTFQSERQSDSKVGDTVSQLAATRNTSFKAADQTFQASMIAARDTLKQAFGSSSASV